MRVLTVLVAMFALAACTKASPAPAAKAPDAALVAPAMKAPDAIAPTASVPVDATVILVDTGIIPSSAADATAAVPVVK